MSIAFGIRNVEDRPRALREMARVTRDGGRVAILELSEPRRGPLAALARFHIHRVVPRIGAALSGSARVRVPPAIDRGVPRAGGLRRHDVGGRAPRARGRAHVVRRRLPLRGDSGAQGQEAVAMERAMHATSSSARSTTSPPPTRRSRSSPCRSRPRRSIASSTAAGAPILRWDDPAAEHDGRAWSFAGAGEAARVEGAGEARFDEIRGRAGELFAEIAARVHPDAAFAPPPRLYGGLAFRPEPVRAAPWSAFRDASFALPRWLYGTSGDRAFLRFARGAGDRLDEAEVRAVHRRDRARGRGRGAAFAARVGRRRGAADARAPRAPRSGRR